MKQRGKKSSQIKIRKLNKIKMKLTLHEDLRTNNRKLKIVMEMTAEEINEYLLERGIMPEGMITVEVKEVK